MSEKKLGAVVLAGGCGKRMKSGSLPKVLVRCGNYPLISYPLKAIKESRVADKLVIVVGQHSDRVIAAVGQSDSSYHFVHQTEQKGTGHAVMVVQDALKGCTDILILYGDHPTIQASTVRAMAHEHLSRGAVLTMATVIVDDFEGWRQSFYGYGRVIRGDDGQVTNIVELADSTPHQGAIKEVSPSYFCFKADWLWQNIGKLRPDNAKEELYLTDLVKIAFSQGRPIHDFLIDPREAIGVNTPEELELVQSLFRGEH